MGPNADLISFQTAEVFASPSSDRVMDKVRKQFPKCGVWIKHSTHFHRHVKRCGEEQHRVKCHHCDKTYSRGDALKRHINTAHPVQKKICCTICKKAFQYEMALHLQEEHCGKEKPSISSVLTVENVLPGKTLWSTTNSIITRQVVL